MMDYLRRVWSFYREYRGYGYGIVDSIHMAHFEARDYERRTMEGAVKL